MKLPEAGLRRDLLIALFFALAAAALRLPRLGFPPEEIFDEVYHAKAALSYLRGEVPLEWVHPPTSKVLVSIPVALFGYSSWSWRLAPALCGTLLAPIFYLLARRVLESERAAILAAALLSMDGVYLVQSRTAMTNIFAVLFQVASAYFVVRAALAPRLPLRDTLCAGLALGLALSSRWTSLWAWGFLGLVVLAVRRNRLLRARELALWAAAFVVVPCLVYAGSYWLYPAIRPTGLKHLIDTQKSMWSYHANLDAQHGYFSHWYTWPWLYRPTWYFFRQQDDAIYGIVALGNPALWWASVPATLWALASGIKARDPRRLFAALGFCCLYLPWGLAPRKLNFSHYLFEALPYACLSVGMLLERVLQTRWRDAAWGYLALCAFLFVFFFPILTAVPLPPKLFYYQLWPGSMLWLWFRSWI